MESKKHFKMYKSGKLWVTAAVLGFSVMAGMTIDNQQVKADDQAPVAVTQTTNAAEQPATTPAADKGTDNQENQATTNQQPTKPATGQGKDQPATKPADPTPADANTQKVVTRTINVTAPDGTQSAQVQKVTFNRTKTQNADGKDVYGEWKAASAAKWDAYGIPVQDGYVSKYVDDKGQDKYVTALPSEDVTASTTDVTYNISYVKATRLETPDPTKKAQQPDLWKKVTRTINYKLAVGTQDPTVQTVWFKRSNNAVLGADGQSTSHYTEWEADGDAVWQGFTVPQIAYYHTTVDGQRGVTIPTVTVTPDTKDESHTVTYISDGTDPYNQQVVAGLQGNWASIDNIHMTDTGIHVTGWNANSDSFNRNYHFLIILDYGPNPVTGHFHEVGRKLVTGGVNRPDVFKVHPVWNAATSGFDDTVNLDLSQIKAGDKLRILSRWTADPNGNENPADLVSSYYTMDYTTNVANLDGMTVTKDGQQLEVAGWNATNQVVGRKYHYIILRDATTGQEIGRQLVKDGIDRPDVAKVYPNLLSASKSGFNVKFNLSGIDLGHNLQVVSRYSDTLGGEGSNVDYWFPARRLVSGTTTNFANLDGVNADGKTGKVTFTGWNATNYSQVEPNHYLILFDATANKQVAAVKLDNKNVQVARPDVQKAYQTVNGALNSGFSYDIDMSQLIFGHTYALVSRYSTSADGNGGDGAYTDYWFNNAFAFNQQAYSVDKLELVAATKDAPKATQPTNGSKAQNAAAKAELKTDQQTDSKATDQQAGDKGTTKGDQQPVATPNQLHVAGWMASDGSGYKNAYVIVLDAKDTKHELGRSQVTLTKRDDVLKAFPTIYNVGQSGFDTTITLSDDAVKAAQADGVQLVLRYTDDKEGNGKLTADQWTTPFKYDQANNEFVKA